MFSELMMLSGINAAIGFGINGLKRGIAPGKWELNERKCVTHSKTIRKITGGYFNDEFRLS